MNGKRGGDGNPSHGFYLGISNLILYANELMKNLARKLYQISMYPQ